MTFTHDTSREQTRFYNTKKEAGSEQTLLRGHDSLESTDDAIGNAERRKPDFGISELENPLCRYFEQHVADELHSPRKVERCYADFRVEIRHAPRKVDRRL